MTISHYIVSFIISLYATVRSYMNYRMLTKSSHKINSKEKHELKLISRFILINLLILLLVVHSALMFLLLGARYIYQITFLINICTRSTHVIVVAQLIIPIIDSVHALCESTMLLIINHQVRRDFFRFYGNKSKIISNISRTARVQIH